MASCEPTFPARTLSTQLTRLAKEEQNVNITCHISGKTLWVYIPLEDLLDEEKIAWNTAGLEKMSKVLSGVHRVLLSTDAKLDFVAIVGADVKKYGIKLTAIEYVPDIKEAVLEKFSRGEFFMRSVRDTAYNPESVGDLTGESTKYYDITFDQFLSLQIIHRTKSLFVKDETLSRLFEIRTTSWSQKFGVIKIEAEFLKKSYDLTAEEEKIRPLDYMKMVAALVVANYDFKNFQMIELTDTFSKESVKLTYKDAKNIKIDLPEFKD